MEFSTSSTGRHNRDEAKNIALGNQSSAHRRDVDPNGRNRPSKRSLVFRVCRDRRLRTAAITSIIACIVLALIIVVGSFHSYVNTITGAYLHTPGWKVQDASLIFTATVVDFDFRTLQSSITLDFIYNGQSNTTSCALYDPIVAADPRRNSSTALYLDSMPRADLPSDRWPNLTIPIAWSGSVTKYPFDVYQAQLPMQAFASPTPCSNFSVELAQPLTVSSYFSIGDDTLSDFGILGTSPTETDYPAAYMTLRRNPALTIFPVIFFIMSWMLTICFVVTTVIITNLPPDSSARDFMLPTIATLGITFLFALPQVRSTLPGAPPGALFFDSVGYFWNIGLVGSSVVVLLCLYIVNLWRKLQPEQSTATRSAEAESFLYNEEMVIPNRKSSEDRFDQKRDSYCF